MPRELQKPLNTNKQVPPKPVKVTIPEPDRQSKLQEILGEEYKDYTLYRDKQAQKEARRNIELKTQTLLETDFKPQVMEANEIWNKVYRAAYAQACKDLHFKESEFPSRY